MKGQRMTGVESQRRETDTEQKMYPHAALFLTRNGCANPVANMSRLERAEAEM